MTTPNATPLTSGKIPNRPCDLGREAGSHLARFTEKAAADLRAAGIEPPEPCSSCAYRRGTIPNGCAQTVSDAINCAITGEPFNCHMGEKSLCRGFLTLQLAEALQ